MKQLMAAVCFMLAASPFALAQDKAKDTDRKAPAAEKSMKSEPTKAKDETRKEPSEKQRAQQQRMKDCAGKAGERKGDERRTFMSSCLKGGDTAQAGEKSDKRTAQQGKMKSCNKEAGDKKMKGEDRKSFMKDCLSK